MRFDEREARPHRSGGEMALGNNRDYKTSDRRGRKGLARHFALMTRLMADCHLDRDMASSVAGAVMGLHVCPLCKGAGSVPVIPEGRKQCVCRIEEWEKGCPC